VMVTAQAGRRLCLDIQPAAALAKNRMRAI
jgi:hypothetical protein